MDIRMASLPGCGLGGGGGGGGGGSSSSSSNSHGNTMVKGYQVTKDNHQTVGPQVTFICGQPPLLDTTGCKPTMPRPTSGFCGSTRKVGGNFLTSLRNMYNSICSSPSLTWVNPEIIPEFHPAAAPSLSLESPYSMADAFYLGQNEPLWYQATPGSQFEYEDPLQVLYPFSNTLPPFSSNLPPGTTTCSFSKSSQPLNPEAKEWVPSGYKDDVLKSSLSDCSEIPFDKNILPKQATGDFIEITESEIDAVRKSSNSELPQKTQDGLVVESSNKKLHPKEGEVTGFCIIPQKYSLESKIKINKNVCCDVLKDDELLEQLKICKVPVEAECFKQQEDRLSPSYASITQKSPEPPIKHNTKIAFEEKNIALAECVKQPLPKIFTKDKIYPKEKAPAVMENKKREVLPFKTPSKLQKRSSKKFLRDLKESSPVNADTSFSGSEGSWESTTDISGFCVSSSPVVLGFHGNEFPREKTESNKSHRSSSESSSSSHVRTVSESTVGSVESIDIEFGEDFDIHENKHDNNHALADYCKSKSSVEGKYVNSIVAHILCFDESDSEDSDNESDDSDWDTVQECILHDVDESWETFGLSIPLLTKSLPCSELGNNKLNISEDVCDNVGNSSLTEINKKWNEEVCKGVVDATPCKVIFGEVKVHPMISWSFAYKNARRGPWEQYARDRSRFNNRVLSLEPIISPILSDHHRKAMYCKLYGL